MYLRNHPGLNPIPKRLLTNLIAIERHSLNRVFATLALCSPSSAEALAESPFHCRTARCCILHLFLSQGASSLSSETRRTRLASSVSPKTHLCSCTKQQMRMSILQGICLKRRWRGNGSGRKPSLVDIAPRRWQGVSHRAFGHGDCI